jgi:hypothetical protein
LRFLTNEECRSWASRRQFPLGQSPKSILAERPPFSVRDFGIPQDAGARVALVRSVWDSVGRGRPETLLWVTDWSVWPSSEHMPLATALRRGLGEERSLIDAPGCMARLGEDDDAMSVLVTAVFFLWDCWLLEADGRLAAFFCHDERGAVCSRDTVPDDLLQRLAILGVLSDAPTA